MANVRIAPVGNRRPGNGTFIDRNVLDVGASRQTLGRRRGGGGGSAVQGASTIQQGSSLDLTQAPAGALPIRGRSAPQGSAGMLIDSRIRRFADIDATQATRNVRTRLGGQTDAQLNAIGRLQPNNGGGLPTIGTQPNFQRKVAGEQGIRMFDGFGAKARLGVGGITPMQKQAGTGNIGFSGFSARPTRLDAAQGAAQLMAQSSAGRAFGAATQPSPGWSPFRDMNWAGGSQTAETNTLGWQSNYTVAYADQLKPETRDFMHHLQRHQLIILYKPGETSGSPLQDRMSRMAGATSVSRQTHIELNLQTFNFMMALTDKASDRNNPFSATTADDVWQDWTLNGIVTGGETGDDDTNVTLDSAASANTFRPVERLLNMVVKGAVDTVNIWGRVVTGTELYLILRRVARKDIRATPDSDEGTYALDPNSRTLRRAPQTDELSTHPFQLVPWADIRNQGAPPIEALRYYEESGAVRTGKAIYVGRVEDYRTSTDPSQNLEQLVPFSTTGVSGPLPTIRVHFNGDSRIQ